MHTINIAFNRVPLINEVQRVSFQTRQTYMRILSADDLCRFAECNQRTHPKSHLETLRRDISCIDSLLGRAMHDCGIDTGQLLF